MRNISELEVKTLFIALLVGVAHVVSGVVVFVMPGAALVAPVAPLVDITAFFGIYGSGIVGLVLFVAGVMAIIGSTFSFARHVHVSLFVPQQILLLLQIYSISWALIEGRYPDGYVPTDGAWFIISDQIWAWILAVSHSIWLAAFIYGGARGGDRH